VSHFPPGTSKWNKIEHRLFSFISINWRGRPLRIYETIINLISNTTNRGGLVVRARLDRRRYPTGKKISAKDFRALKIDDAFHGGARHRARRVLELRRQAAAEVAVIGRLPDSRALIVVIAKFRPSACASDARF
jgi:hypothetical protein